jgi:hypothetical protein
MPIQRLALRGRCGAATDLLASRFAARSAITSYVAAILGIAAFVEGWRISAKTGPHTLARAGP